MSTVTETITHSPPRTLAELVERLGNIPLERIRMQPAPGTATESDLIDINEENVGRFELVDGCLVDEDIVIDSIKCDGPPLTAAQLVHQLGDIPLERIRMQPPPGTASEDDVVKTKLCELVDGVIVEKAMAFLESSLAAVLIGYMRAYLQGNRIGIVVAPDAMMRILPHQIREPDVSFISAKQMPDGKVPKEPIASLFPDLAVEILSPNNTNAEMNRKRREYFQAGTSLVWLVDPRKKNVRVFTGVESFREFAHDQVVDGGDVMPGFRVSIREWFDEAENVEPTGLA